MYNDKHINYEDSVLYGYQLRVYYVQDSNLSDVILKSTYSGTSFIVMPCNNRIHIFCIANLQLFIAH